MGTSHEQAKFFKSLNGSLTDLNDLYWAHKGGREADLRMQLIPGKVVDFECETVVSAAYGESFEATGDPFIAKIKYLGSQAIEGANETVYLVEDERGQVFETTWETLHRDGIYEGSDADFGEESDPVLKVHRNRNENNTSKD